MVKHIVMWTLNPDQKENAEKIAAELREKFGALPGVVEGLTAVELGRNYNGGKYDLVLACTLASKEAEQAYQNHPAHIAIKNVIHTLVCARECVDYEL